VRTKSQTKRLRDRYATNMESSNRGIAASIHGRRGMMDSKPEDGQARNPGLGRDQRSEADDALNCFARVVVRLDDFRKGHEVPPRSFEKYPIHIPDQTSFHVKFSIGPQNPSPQNKQWAQKR